MKQMSVLAAIAAFLVFIPLSQALAVDTVTVKTARGEKAVAVKPKTVAVLDLSAADMLVALGIDIKGSPKRTWLTYLKKPLEKAKPIGSLFEPDYEAIYKLKPNLIVAGGRSWNKVPELNRIAPTIDMTIWGKDHFKQVRERLLALGKIFALEDKAEALLKEMNDKLAELKAISKGKGRALIILTNGSKVTVFGRFSRFGWLHAETGIPEAVPTDVNKAHGEIISFELIAKTDPDWLFVVDRGAAIGQSGPSAKATLDNELMRKTKAWKNKRIVYLNSANLYLAGGGIQSIMMTMDSLIDVFKKE